MKVTLASSFVDYCIVLAGVPPKRLARIGEVAPLGSLSHRCFTCSRKNCHFFASQRSTASDRLSHYHFFTDDAKCNHFVTVVFLLRSFSGSLMSKSFSFRSHLEHSWSV